MVAIKTSHKILIIIAMLFGLSALSKVNFFNRKIVKYQKYASMKCSTIPNKVLSVDITNKNREIHESLMMQAMLKDMGNRKFKSAEPSLPEPVRVYSMPTPRAPEPMRRVSVKFDDYPVAPSVSAKSICIDDDAYARAMRR
jgi:hypothetical protein